MKKSDILAGLAEHYDNGDLKFIETVHDTAFEYKMSLRKNFAQNKKR